MENHNNFRPIPALFHSFHESDLFRRCIECDRNLLEEGCEYVIEKAIRNYPNYKAQDVIFDYAICMDCALKINQELSKESLRHIQQYFLENVDVRHNRQRIARADGDIEKLTGECMIKGTAAGSSGEFQIYAHCIGDKINLENPPYMISGEVLDEVADLISEETRDTLNGFFNKHFSPDPTLLEPIPDRPRLVLI